MSLGDPGFIHQHVVDTYAAQTHGPDGKTITLAQALIGLYLHVEHGFDGRGVQRVHTLLADRRPDWPAFELGVDRGPLTVRDVLEHAAGAERDATIQEWAASTWHASERQRPAVERFLTSLESAGPGE